MPAQVPEPTSPSSAGAVGVLRVNYARFQRAHWLAKLMLLGATAISIYLVWYKIDTWGEARGIEEQCKAKCGALSYRIDIVLLDPHAGAAARRNVRERRCVCGSAP